MRQAAKRRQMIRELLRRNRIESQLELLELLGAEGFSVDQATVSRDLHELGARKVHDAYALPPEGVGDSRDRRRAMSALRDRIDSAMRGGSMVIVRAKSGQGRAVWAEIESASLPHVLGAVFAGDTIFMATESATQARIVLRLIESG